MADGQIEVDILGNTSDFDKAVDGLTDTVSAKTIALGSVLADLAKKAISSLAGAVSDAIDTGMSFEKSMSNVAALQQAAGAAADDIAHLKQAAEEYGASTQFTMTQCSDALSYMALAGWDAQKSIEELPGVLNLAAAADMDLAKASDMVTDYMSAFSKSVSDYTGEALTAIEFSDKLAYAQANSNTNAMQLGEAFKNCAANLNAAGQQMDTVTALLGTMANQGKKGSEAGTAMSAIMRDLTNAMDDGAISINGTSIAIADAKGNYRDLIDITADIERATNGMGETQRAAALSAAFTSDSIAGLNLILNAGTEEVRKLEAGLSDCEGAAENMAATLNDNLAGDITYMQSALDAVKNSVFEGINPALRSLVQLVTNDVAPNLTMLVNGLIGAASGVTSAGNLIHDSVAAMGEALKDTILDALSKLPDIFKAGLRFRDAFMEALAELLPEILPALTEVIYEMARHLIAGIPLMVQAAATLLQGIADALLGVDFGAMLTDLIGILVSRLRSGSNLLVKAAISLFSSITEALPAMLEGGTQIMEALMNGITELLPVLISLGMELLETLLSGLLSAFPQLMAAAAKLLRSFVGFIQENLPVLISASISLLDMLMKAIVENVPLLLEAAIRIISALAGMLIENAAQLADAAIQLVFTLVQMLLEHLPELLTAAIRIVLMLGQMLIENAALLLDAAIQIISALAGMLIENAAQLADAAIQLVFTLVQMLLEHLPELLTAAIRIVFMLGQMLIENAALLLDAAIDLIFALVQMITDNLDLILDAALAIITAIADGIVENLPGLVTAALGIIITLVQGISEHLPELVEAAIMILETLVTFVSENTGDIVQAGLDILMALLDGLAEAAPNLWDAIQQLIDTIWNMIMETDWIGLGVQILTGLAEGLTAGLSVVWDTIQNVGGEIVGGFKDFFGIHSPSHLMRDEIGKFMLPGIPVGMEATADETAADIQSALDDVLNSIDMDAMQMHLNAAVQMQEAEAVPTGFTAGIKKEADRAEAPSSPHDPTGWDGDMIFNVSFGNEPFDRMVISAIDRANAISGGVDV